MFNKLLYIFTAFIIIIFTSFSVPAFAYTYPPDSNIIKINEVSNLPSPGTNFSLSTSECTYVYVYSSPVLQLAVTDEGTNAFVVYVKNPSDRYQYMYDTYLISDSNTSRVIYQTYNNNNGNGTVTFRNANADQNKPRTLDSTTELYYLKDGTGYDEDTFNYGFSDLTSALTAVKNYIDNPPSSTSILEVPFINSDPQNIDPSEALYIGSTTNDRYIYQRVNKPICVSILNSNFAFSSLTQNARFVIVEFNDGQYVSYQEGVCNVAYNSPDTFYSNNMHAVPVNHNSSIASYSDSSTWQSDVYDFLQTTHSEALLNKPLTLNPGNVIWIEAEPDTTYSIKAEFDVLSDLFGNTWNPHTMQFGRQNIIQQGQYPLQGGNDLVPTTNNTDDTNMVGQSKIGYTTITHGNSTYIYIYNPYYRRYAPGLTYVTNLHNPVLTITPSKPVYNAVYLPLDNQLNLTTGIVGSTDSDNSQSVSVDPNTGEYIYSGVVNGEDTSSTTPPPSGGQNLQNVAQGNTLGITDYLNKITETITEFTTNILELVKAPISHIGQLIEAGSGFMSALRGMYAWLPVDIQGLVISALTIVIGIGVFKVFL